MDKPTFFIVAGEHSGDLLGAHLARALQQHTPCQLKGIGSKNMQAAGVELIFNSDELAVMGAIEVVKKLGVLKKAMRTLKQHLQRTPPDLLILIDYPGFNLRVAAYAKSLGIKVMYYASPQIWAWHYSRIKKIKEYVDLMTVLYPFEEKIYQHENVPVKYVGHPLIDAAAPTISKQCAYDSFGLNPTKPVVGLLPGSRLNEIQKLLPVMLQCVKLIKSTVKEAQFILPLSDNLDQNCLTPFDLSEVTVVHHNTYNAIQLCNAAIVTSGTVTLEVAMLQVPQVIIYKVNAVTAWIGRIITNLKQIGLCNIVAEETVALELLQENVNPTTISHEIIKLLKDQAYHDEVIEKLSRLKNKVDNNNASQKAAQAALSLLC